MSLCDPPARVLVGQFLLEANTFAPGRTTLADFEVAGLLVGDELRREALPVADELHAAWGILEHAGATVVPSIRAWVGAGPMLTASAFDHIAGHILEWAQREIDGVFLSLHGASAAEGIDDPEGHLLQLLRAAVPDAAIAVSLDCHAGITPAMIASADILTGYRTVPHVDLARTGGQAAELLVAMLRGEIDPRPAAVTIPMIGPADRQDNRLPVFGAIMDEVAASEDDNGILATSFFPSHPWRDVEDLCWSVVVVADGDPALARTTAAGIAGKVWESRHEFVSGDRPDLAEALQSALLGPTPCVIADAGDSPTGGALGNSTEFLRASLPHRDRSIWMLVHDAAAARRAARTPVGSELDLEIGTGSAGTYNERTRIRATVLAHPEGGFRYEASLAEGKLGHLGTAALLGISELRIIVHDLKVLLIDPSPYRGAGLDPTKAEVLQAKSHVTFKEGFRTVAVADFVADTPGPTAANLELLPYQKRPRPLFPFESDTTFEV